MDHETIAGLYLFIGILSVLPLFWIMKRVQTICSIIRMEDGPDLEAEDREIDAKLAAGELEVGEEDYEKKS
jgi:hypothetical protein